MSEKKQKLTKEQLDTLMKQLSSKSLQQNSNTPDANKKMPAFARFLQFLSSMVRYLDRFVHFVVKPKDSERNDVIQYARPPIIFGVYVILIFFGIGLPWAAFAPLDSAAGATGILVSDSQKQLIQHRQGGYLKAVYVKVGDKVQKDQPLLFLEDPALKARFEQIQNSYRNSLASKARLKAHADGLKNIDFPEELLSIKDETEIKQLLAIQDKLFHSKNDAIISKISSLKKQIDQTHIRIDTLKSQKVSDTKNLDFSNSRFNSIKKLFDKGFAYKSQIEEADKNHEIAKNELYKTNSSIMTYEQELSKLASEIKTFKSEHLSKTMEELKETIEKMISTKEELLSLQDSIDKEIIRSPVDGTVNVINVHTIGAYIQPHAHHGAPNPGQSTSIMEITPDGENLIIDARIPATKIASVRVGLKAKIRFSAYKSRTSPTFTGTVISMSSDAIEDQKSLQMLQMKGLHDDSSFYTAKIEMDMEEFNRIATKRGLELKPGMRAEITIITGERTLLRYLLDPVTDNMFRAFNEK